MRWLVFVVAISAFANGQVMRVTLEDRAVLGIPHALCFNFSLLQSNNRLILAEGYAQSGKTMFAFSRLRGVFLESIKAENLEETGLMSLLKDKGLLNPSFELLGDSANHDLHPRSVFRILDPDGVWDNHLLALEARKDPGGTSFFVLLGPQSEFYKMTPLFSDMVTNYEIQNVHYEREMTPKLVIGSIVLVLLNLGFVWFGFYRLAHMRSQRLED